MNEESFRNLIVYEKAFALAMEIFHISKGFPKEETKSSRSVCSSIGEAYRKRQYPAHFVSKSSDGDSENSETRVWLDFAKACHYINEETWYNLEKKAHEVRRLLNHMIENPEKYERKGTTKASTEKALSK